MENTINISASLRTWRVKHHLKQETVASKLAISRPQYSKIESGEKPFTVELLLDLASVFDLSPTALLGELLSYDANASKLLKDNNSNGVSKVPNDLGSLTEELIFYKKLSDVNEKKYLDMYRIYLEKCGGDNKNDSAI